MFSAVWYYFEFEMILNDPIEHCIRNNICSSAYGFRSSIRFRSAIRTIEHTSVCACACAFAHDTTIVRLFPIKLYAFQLWRIECIKCLETFNFRRIIEYIRNELHRGKRSLGVSDNKFTKSISRVLCKDKPETIIPPAEEEVARRRNEL